MNSTVDHDLARSDGGWGSDLEFRCRINRAHLHFAWSVSVVPGKSASDRSAFNQRESSPRREGLNSAHKRIGPSLSDSEKAEPVSRGRAANADRELDESAKR